MPASPNLIRFIHSHGNPVRDNGDGTVTVHCDASVHGVAAVEFVTIPATIQAARDLLGY